jgi:transcriptional regulator with XRE-family HTH domain
MNARKFQELKDQLYAHDAGAEARVAAKVVELTEQLGLSALRSARDRTQAELARAIGTTQSGVSRIERQQDLLISTLRDYVAATGGRLRVLATFDDFETEIDLPVLRPPADGPREFRVIWQNSLTRKFVHVGWLEYDGGQFSFTYTPEAELDGDFTPFTAFPDFRTPYRSPELFDFFAERIAAVAGGEATLAQALGLEQGTATPVELLARSWGLDPHDTVQVVPEPTVTPDGTSVRTFLASGVRHVDEANPEAVAKRIAKLKPGDPLILRDEPTNPVNDRAIVLDADGKPVGWMPDYLLDAIRKHQDAGDRIRVFVEHANGPDVAWHLRLLCRIEVKLS